MGESEAMGMGIRGGGAARQLQALFEAGAVGSMDDGELLGRFLRRDESAEPAFAALVGRHGRMVLRVCRDVLGDPHEAQDAAQATFFILARKAAAIRKPEALPSWLHGTARRVASRALRDSIRRRRHERKSAEAKPTPEPSRDDSPRGWPELHEELARLPDRYREPIVLCDLAGLTHEQAAGKLGCPPRTLETRLYRGRERLKDRLVRRGLAPSAALVGVAWASETQAAMPLAWVASTAGAAVRLAGKAGWASAGDVPANAVRWARRHLREMVMVKMKIVVATGVIVGIIAGEARSRMAQDDGKRPKVENVSRPPDAIEEGPKPQDAFERTYVLADGEDVKALLGPAIQARNEHYRGKGGEIGLSQDPGFNGSFNTLFFRWRDGNRKWTITMSPEPVQLRELLKPVLGIPAQEVEGDKALLETSLPADFLIRDGVLPEILVPQFEKILRRDFGFPAKLQLRTEIRNAIVVRGRYRFNASPDRKPFPTNMDDFDGDRLEVFAREIGDRDHRQDGHHTEFYTTGNRFPSLISGLGAYLNLQVIDEVESPPKGWLSWHITGYWPRKDIWAEDRELILKHLAEQTGLTFLEEPRAVRVLRVGRDK